MGWRTRNYVGSHPMPLRARIGYATRAMSDPLVSIVLRSFNEAWALGDTLAALPVQDYKNWELIVIDSGSTDGSVELIQRAQPRHFVQIQPHEYNPARVLNHGLTLAR